MPAVPMNVRVFKLLEEKVRWAELIVSTSNEKMRARAARKLQAVLAEISTHLFYESATLILEAGDRYLGGKTPQAWVDRYLLQTIDIELNLAPSRVAWPGQRELTYTPPFRAS